MMMVMETVMVIAMVTEMWIVVVLETVMVVPVIVIVFVFFTELIGSAQ